RGICNEPLQHDADHGEADEGGDGSGVALEITCQAPETAEPSKRAFDDPALGQDFESDGGGAASNDLDRPAPGLGRRSPCLRPLIAAIAVDALNEREQTTRAAVEHQRHPVAILNVGGMHRHAQQEAERIDQNVALATADLLARIEALRVERGPPFCAPLALWLSMIAVVGLASRPACSRTATRDECAPAYHPKSIDRNRPIPCS